MISYYRKINNKEAIWICPKCNMEETLSMKLIEIINRFKSWGCYYCREKCYTELRPIPFKEICKECLE